FGFQRIKSNVNNIGKFKFEFALGQLRFGQVMLPYRVNTHAREAAFDLQEARLAFLVLFSCRHPKIRDTTGKRDLRECLYKFVGLVAAGSPTNFSQALSNAAEWNDFG